MKNFTGIIAICAVLMSSSPVVATDIERGQELYKNHCRSCHESWVHTRQNHRVASISELRLRVAGWSSHTGLMWSKNEIDDVTDYLSSHFYQLTDQP